MTEIDLANHLLPAKGLFPLFPVGLHPIVTRDQPNYSSSMYLKRLFVNANKAGLVLCAAMLGLLTGCAGHVQGPRAGAFVRPAAMEEAVVVVQDDSMYYPSFAVYDSGHQGQYAYRQAGVPVSPPVPQIVLADILPDSRFMIDLHDSPAHSIAVVH